ncbi:helix-turn-helix transcriptional regulator [Paenibacillus kribbensis]|uniref:helix-turn-helix domain-containing protein n=1 Tax=Paenibacillus kribbensis TaxID=172713 RepID=UPI002DBE025E|nr:helix-turn-helix transcriptional regulator [Paenibacillus kribbensis]MEC0234094.1 helix-turn-helix transcriptional regulator [Paenibacillus kribbensis]
MVKKNMKGKDLMEVTGLTKPTVSKLMNDKQVALDVLDRICEALDVELHEVIRRKKEQEG